MTYLYEPLHEKNRWPRKFAICKDLLVLCTGGNANSVCACSFLPASFVAEANCVCLAYLRHCGVCNAPSTALVCCHLMFICSRACFALTLVCPMCSLKATAKGNGARGVKIVDKAEIEKLEPNVHALGAVYAPLSGLYTVVLRFRTVLRQFHCYCALMAIA